ncbi:hypothetical protein [uncultured Tenacibaculum sp.]|uniref:hypothetical protein n=1 Tax=uncultured Tenacibaculum sp. TaxID=174713 RepID=UPI00261D99F7|nr:hypothetical protein [uncultured Tenacibaculum sp.]
MLFNYENNNDSIEISTVQQKYSIPAVKQTKEVFEQTIFSKNTRLKSGKDLDIVWKASKIKEFKENINFLYTPINLNTDKRLKSLVASVKKITK